MAVRDGDTPALFARVQESNLIRQYDLLLSCVEVGLVKGIEAFDKYTLWSLNAAAVSNIAQFGGRYREEPIYVGDHMPPHFSKVADEMDRFISVVHENWTVKQDPLILPAYALWRMNWIHPSSKETGGRQGLRVTTSSACGLAVSCPAGGSYPSASVQTANPTTTLCKQQIVPGSKAILT